MRSRSSALIFSLTSAINGVCDQRHVPAALPSGKTRYPLYRRLGGPQGRSGRVRKFSSPTGIRSPDRPARSESLYRLSYPGTIYIYIYRLLKTVSFSITLNIFYKQAKLVFFATRLLIYISSEGLTFNATCSHPTVTRWPHSEMGRHQFLHREE